jgi:hypothetical protein
MNCEYTEKVSLLLDGELSTADTEEARRHLTGCHACQQVEQDFLRLRQQIRSPVFEADAIMQRQTLWKVLASQRPPFWRRQIAMPAPVLAIVLAAWVALGIWFVFTRAARPINQGMRQISPVPASAVPNNEASGIDLSRFDHGERAMVYKERRSDPGAVNKGARR